MLFLSIIHSLVNLPRDLYSFGIKNCKKAIHTPTSNLNNGAFAVKFEKFGSVENVITQRIKNQLPSTFESIKASFADVLKPALDPAFWAQPKNLFIAVNGYEATTKNSVFLLISMSNEGVVGGIKLMIQTSTEPATCGKSFTFFSSFGVKDGKIVDIKHSQDEATITEDMISGAFPAVAPFYYGTAVFSNNEFVAPASAYIASNTPKYAKQMKLNGADITDALSSFAKSGVVDFYSIYMKVQKVCQTTPTPSPAPTPRPTKIPEPEPELNNVEEKPSRFKWFRRVRVPHRKQQVIA